MSKTLHGLLTGYTYAVTTSAGCTVTDANTGAVLLVVEAEDHQGYYTATGPDITLSDDNALHTEVFKGAPAGNAKAGGTRFCVVKALPAVGRAGWIYLLPYSSVKESDRQNNYEEYAWIDGAWEKLGQRALDLSGYVTTAKLREHTGDTTAHVTAAERAAWNGKAAASDLSAHTGNATAHLTAEERERWNGKADASALSGHTADMAAHLTAAEHSGLTELLNNAGNGGGAYLPDSTFASWAFERTGKVYRSRVYKYDYNPASAVTADEAKLLDNAGLEHKCSTDTTEGVDDYANIPLFRWFNCNYIRMADGSPRITALEGQPEYATTGAVDVGVCGMAFWYSVQDTADGQYQEWTISDKPHPELGLVPWPECVRGDGSIAPYWCHSKYFSGIAADGNHRSQPGLAPVVNMSHNTVLSNYQKKGAGYWGGGISVPLFGMLFDVIKNATKHSQGIHAGCTSYYVRYTSALSERAEELAAFPATKANADAVVVGTCCHIGTTATDDRNSTAARDVAAYATVVGKENVYDESGATLLYVNILLDCAPFAISQTVYLQVTHWKSGATDAVIGHHDGSPGSNTDGKHPYRVQGTEYAVGAWCVCADAVMIRDSAGTQTMYVARRGVAHSGTQATILNTYTPAGEGMLNASKWVGDLYVNSTLGAFYPNKAASGDGYGHRDYYYAPGGAGTYEVLHGGGLNYSANAGSASLSVNSTLGNGSWAVSARD